MSEKKPSRDVRKRELEIEIGQLKKQSYDLTLKQNDLNNQMKEKCRELNDLENSEKVPEGQSQLPADDKDPAGA